MPRQVLAPAKVQPAVDLCSLQLQVFQDGNAGPLLCSNGLNVLAWNYFVLLGSYVMSLGPQASLQAVRDSLCADIVNHHATNAEEASAYQLSAAYYGWNLAFSATDFLTGGGCH